MTKQWIYKGEYREVKRGETFISELDGSVMPALNDVVIPLPIVYPMPDDAVMVDRKAFEEASYVYSFGPMCARGACAEAFDKVFQRFIAMKQCVLGTPKPKDGILEALKGARGGINGRSPLVETIRANIDKAIALREAELKERET